MPQKAEVNSQSYQLHFIATRLLHVFKQDLSSEVPKKVITTVVPQYPRGIGSRTLAHGIK